MAYKNRQQLLGWPIKQAMVTGINKGNGMLDWPTKNRQWLLGWPIKQAIVTGTAYKKAMVVGMPGKTNNGCWAILSIKTLGCWPGY